ncbi:uncharacterized protein LOC124285273 isoform X2 [Haliotis rubra]|uniref:uncharacterized protein LOC124285273 isoform X2 n=1 Tax=Haliotis rubra TaxID=36100 RepID=UPI001EE529B6|nr:uncharacterized protein LOC124285273 isoform X2 [Haliotis rubra]
MATTKKLTDNHLTCVICTEVFTHPATLHCNHTFCKSCLLKYTNTQPEAVQAKSIPCPSCRQLTKVTTPDSPVEEWVSQLKPSHVIQGLMDDFGPGTEPGDVNNCSVCPATERVVFTHDMDKLSKAVDELQLGDVEVVRGVSDHQSTPVLHHTLDCQANDGVSRLYDVTLLTVEGIKITVAADYFNKKVKTFHTSNTNTHGYHLLLSNRPWQIAKLSESRIAVCVPDSKGIVTVDVPPHPVLLSTMKTRKKYFALDCLSPSQLVAGTNLQSHSVDILDMTGKILKSINTGVIGNPDYIHVTRNNNLIVSEGLLDSLVSVTSEGEAVFTYTPTGDRDLKRPQGITTTSTGDIPLVDRISHKVIQLTGSGQFVRDVLTQQDCLESPRGICLDGDGFLYVTCKHCVRVFRFK